MNRRAVLFDFLLEPALGLRRDRTCRWGEPARERGDPVTIFDIVGDVHGEADKLVGLLQQLGYRERDGAFKLSGHQAILVGDLIDRSRSRQRRCI